MHLKISFSKNSRVEPLQDGTVTLEGIEAEWMTGASPGVLHHHHLTHDTADVFEFSLSNYMILKGKPQPTRQQWIGLPIFLSKTFHWGNVSVPKGSSLSSLADLRGKRLAVPDYHMTAGVWLRIMLRHLYGIDPREIHWFNGRTADESHGDDPTGSLSPEIKLTHLEEKGAVKRMLASREIDAAFGGSGSEVGTGDALRPLLTREDKEQVLADLYTKTGVMPVNHVLLMQTRLAQANPDLPRRLYDAFEQSKQKAYGRAKKAAEGYLLFPEEEVERQAALFGEDPYPSGLRANARMLEMVADEETLEGLVPRKHDVPSLFAREVWDT